MTQAQRMAAAAHLQARAAERRQMIDDIERRLALDAQALREELVFIAPPPADPPKPTGPTNHINQPAGFWATALVLGVAFGGVGLLALISYVAAFTRPLP